MFWLTFRGVFFLSGHRIDTVRERKDLRERHSVLRTVGRIFSQKDSAKGQDPF
jgi:hypothetical protein